MKTSTHQVLMQYLFLLVFLIVLDLGNSRPAMIKWVIAFLGQEARFEYQTDTRLLHAHFGKMKNGSLGPDPFVMRVDEKNKVYIIDNTSYSARLKYEGNVKSGLVVFILQNTECNDSNSFLMYLKEDNDKAMYSIGFKLEVRGKNSTTGKTGNNGTLPSNTTAVNLNTPTLVKNKLDITISPDDTSMNSNVTISSNDTYDPNITNEKTIVGAVVGAVVVVVMVVVVLLIARRYNEKLKRNIKGVSDEHQGSESTEGIKMLNEEKGSSSNTEDNTGTDYSSVMRNWRTQTPEL